MVKRPEVLAIIPARGGSKGIPRKNINLFAGYPLISYSIAAGLQAESVTRVIVSTDDDEIAAVARQWGAETPFMRPAELAQDQTTDLPVFQHALRWLKDNEGYSPDLVIQLRPTSPIRPRNCIDEAVALLQRNPGADSVRGVVPSGQNPYKMWRLQATDKPMAPLLSLESVSEPFNAPRQALPPTYWQTGHIDVIRPGVILEENSMSGRNILPYLIDPRYTVDIDTPFDWLRYEWLVRNGNLEFADNEFFALQSLSRMPTPLAWVTPVGHAYRLLASGCTWQPASAQTTIASSAMGMSDVPADTTPTRPPVGGRAPPGPRTTATRAASCHSSLIVPSAKRRTSTSAPDNTRERMARPLPLAGMSVGRKTTQGMDMYSSESMITRSRMSPSSSTE